MRAALFILLLAFPLLLPAQSLQQPERPDVPRLTAKTSRWSRNENVFRDETGAQITETVRQQGVDIEVYFTSRPRRAYEIQAFFFARVEESGQPYIYDAKTLRLTDQVRREVIRSEPLLGTVIRTERATVLGQTGDGQNFMGEVLRNHSEGGSKVYGWVVRVISLGKVVRLESNQTSLKRLAEESPELLDDALIELETAASSKQ